MLRQTLRFSTFSTQCRKARGCGVEVYSVSALLREPNDRSDIYMCSLILQHIEAADRFGFALFHSGLPIACELVLDLF